MALRTSATARGQVGRHMANDQPVRVVIFENDVRSIVGVWVSVASLTGHVTRPRRPTSSHVDVYALYVIAVLSERLVGDYGKD